MERINQKFTSLNTTRRSCDAKKFFHVPTTRNGSHINYVTCTARFTLRGLESDFFEVSDKITKRVKEREIPANLISQSTRFSHLIKRVIPTHQYRRDGSTPGEGNAINFLLPRYSWYNFLSD